MKIIVDRLPESEKDCPYCKYAASDKNYNYECQFDHKKCNLDADYFRLKCRWLRCHQSSD